MKVKATAGQIIVQLRKRFDDRGYAFLEQVRGGTGAYGSRYCDALVMSLWPSRGFDVVGFEVKVSRSDWLCELKQPEKADEIFRFCTEWWLVAAQGIVRDGELPKPWGLMESSADGELSTITAAPTLTPEPLTAAFIASVLRCAAKDEPGKERLAEQFNAGVGEGQRQERLSLQSNLESAKRRHDDLKQSVAQFEAASGIAIKDWNGGLLGQEFATFLKENRALHQVRRSLEGIKSAAERIVAEVNAAAVTP